MLGLLRTQPGQRNIHKNDCLSSRAAAGEGVEPDARQLRELHDKMSHFGKSVFLQFLTRCCISFRDHLLSCVVAVGPQKNLEGG